MYIYIHKYQYIYICIYREREREREIMLFIGKPMGRSIMISNTTKNLEKNLYLGVRVVHPFVFGWFVILL